MTDGLSQGNPLRSHIMETVRFDMLIWSDSHNRFVGPYGIMMEKFYNGILKYGELSETLKKLALAGF